MPRFDEIELEPVPFGGPPATAATSLPVADDSPSSPAPLLRRMFALLVDLSLFGALAVALSPLLPSPLPSTSSRPALAALGGFVVVVSFPYFIGPLMLWGRPIRGPI